VETPENEVGTEADRDEIARLFAHPGVDWPTLALCAVMWTGLLANFWWALSIEEWTFWAACAHVAVGTFFLNMSFTIWHEAGHGTIFKARAANDLVGVIGAWPAMLPYFTVRRDHILHHEHVNDPERDPDYWFLEGSIWSLPFRYPKGAKRALEIVDRAGRPAWEKRADRGLLLLVLITIGMAAWFTSPLVILTTWLLPKGFAMWIHAWYVNVLPHRGLPAERYRDTRVITSKWLTPLMLCHNYHGIHHVWMTVPWHRYPKVFRARRAFLEGRQVPISD
jgi:fatty acid desaturase